MSIGGEVDLDPSMVILLGGYFSFCYFLAIAIRCWAYFCFKGCSFGCILLCSRRLWIISPEVLKIFSSKYAHPSYPTCSNFSIASPGILSRSLGGNSFSFYWRALGVIFGLKAVFESVFFFASLSNSFRSGDIDLLSFSSCCSSTTLIPWFKTVSKLKNWLEFLVN